MIELAGGQPARHFTLGQVRAFRALLQVERGASVVEISAAFRAKVLEYHPDKVAALGKELRDLAERKTKELTEAYHVLRDIEGGNPRKAEVVFEASSEEESPAPPPARSEPSATESVYRPRRWPFLGVVAVLSLLIWMVATPDTQREAANSGSVVPPRATVAPEPASCCRARESAEI